MNWRRDPGNKAAFVAKGLLDWLLSRFGEFLLLVVDATAECRCSCGCCCSVAVAAAAAAVATAVSKVISCSMLKSEVWEAPKLVPRRTAPV